jgi:RNA polymerase sigma-70 factor (ECF subfamily)
MGLEAQDFSRLYRRHAQSLLVFFARRVDDPELATDLMADTFAMALDRREQFRGTTEQELSGWLWSIARSMLREHQRRGEIARRGARRLGSERRELNDREIERIEELAGCAQLRETAARRLGELPREQREAVRLRVLEDLSYEQVAERLGLSVEAARMRVSRALRRLAKELKDEPGAPQP